MNQFPIDLTKEPLRRRYASRYKTSTARNYQANSGGWQLGLIVEVFVQYLLIDPSAY